MKSLNKENNKLNPLTCSGAQWGHGGKKMEIGNS